MKQSSMDLVSGNIYSNPWLNKLSTYTSWSKNPAPALESWDEEWPVVGPRTALVLVAEVASRPRAPAGPSWSREAADEGNHPFLGWGYHKMHS